MNQLAEAAGNPTTPAIPSPASEFSTQALQQLMDQMQNPKLLNLTGRPFANQTVGTGAHDIDAAAAAPKVPSMNITDVLQRWNELKNSKKPKK